VTDVTRDPLYVVEDMGFVPDSLAIGHGPPEGRNFFRITANSSGASDTAEAVLESTYTRRF
jgi:type IV pilus assembly protein PilX